MSTKPKDSIDYIKMGRVTPNDFQKTKYSVKNFSYPIDLFGENYVNVNQVDPNNIYGKNYVIFFINVSVDSKIVKSIHTKTVDDSEFNRRKRAEVVGRNVDNNVSKGTVAGSAVAAGVLSEAAMGTIGINIGSGIGIRGGVVAAGAIYAAGDRIGSFTRPQKRLQTAIALHVPNQLNISYGVDWNEENTMLYSYATTGGAEAEKMIKSFLDIN